MASDGTAVTEAYSYLVACCNSVNSEPRSPLLFYLLIT